MRLAVSSRRVIFFMFKRNVGFFSVSSIGTREGTVTCRHTIPSRTWPLHDMNPNLLVKKRTLSIYTEERENKNTHTHDGSTQRRANILRGARRSRLRIRIRVNPKKNTNTNTDLAFTRDSLVDSRIVHQSILFSASNTYFITTSGRRTLQ